MNTRMNLSVSGFEPANVVAYAVENVSMSIVGNITHTLTNSLVTSMALTTDENFRYTDSTLMNDNLTYCAVWNGTANVTTVCEQGVPIPTPIAIQYQPVVYQAIWIICWGLVLLAGVIGNCMVVLVVCRISHMRTPTNCYLVSLAIADSLVLIVACVPSNVALFLPNGIWPYGNIGCKLSIYLQYVAINVSSLSITAFTIERYIAICHPMKAQTLCTLSRAKKIIIGLWIFAILYCIPWLFFVGTAKKGILANGRHVEWCVYTLHRETEVYTFMYLVDLCAFYVAPAILSVLLYGLIAKILFTNTVPHNETRNSFRHRHKNGVGKKEKKKMNTASSSRKQVIKMLVVVVVLFLTLWAPYRILVVYNSFNAMFLDKWYLAFAQWCIFMNSAINPILYNFMSIKFRRAFIRLCGCGRRSVDYLYARADTVTTRASPNNLQPMVSRSLKPTSYTDDQDDSTYT